MIFFFFKCSSAKLLQHMTLDKLSNQVCQMESTKLMSIASLKEQKIKCPLCRIDFADRQEGQPFVSMTDKSLSWHIIFLIFGQKMNQNLIWKNHGCSSADSMKKMERCGESNQWNVSREKVPQTVRRLHFHAQMTGLHSTIVPPANIVRPALSSITTSTQFISLRQHLLAC